MIMTSTTNQDFVSREEFLNYKKAVHEEFLQSYKRIDALTAAVVEGFARNDKRHEEIITIMISGFDQVYERLAEHDRKFIELDEKIDILTDTMLDGFDRIYDKIGA